MQFEFDEETNFICKRFVDLHEQLIYPYVSRIPLDGSPIIRPIWWLEPPTNASIYEINDQFLIGDDFLVAPVLDPGVDLMEVYFPSGTWYNLDKQCGVVGPCRGKLTITLETTPYFISQNYAQTLGFLNGNFF